MSRGTKYILSLMLARKQLFEEWLVRTDMKVTARLAKGDGRKIGGPRKIAGRDARDPPSLLE